MSESAYEMLFGGEAAESETDTAQTDVAAQAAAAEAQEAALQAEVDRYVRLLPEIEAATPLPAQAGGQQAPAERLSGAAWIEDRLQRVLDPVSAGATVTVGTVGATVAASVIPPAGVKGKPLAETMLAAIAEAGNLGAFDVVRAGGSAFTLRRDGVGAVVDAWARHGQKAAQFHDDPEYRVTVWDAAGLSVPSPKKGKKRRPRCAEFSEDSRGGSVTLELPGGLTIEHVRKARASLRQSLRAPDLEVSERGVHPVLHLNTKRVTGFEHIDVTLRPELFVRPRTLAERHVAAPDFVLPLGVRADGSPILISQAVAPSMGIFAAAGMGKTILLEQMVRAAVLQGAGVILVDAKSGKDFLRIARENLPGVTHYAAGSEAALHRAVLHVRDTFELRKRLASRLQREGIEYRPVPLLLVFDEAPAWLDDAISGTDKEARKAAEQTIANLSWICSQAREQKCFVLTAGQYAYQSAFAGRWKANTNTLVVLGPPSEINRQALFGAGEQRDRARELGAQLTKSAKGRGLYVDVETGAVEMFQGFYNAPGSAAAQRFHTEVMKAPRLRRFAWRFPRGSDPGGDGSWQEWTPTSDPSSDDLPLLYLDDEAGRPISEVDRFNPFSTHYDPGARPLRPAAIPGN